ncbi:MAG: acyl carrier protein [Pseudobutyrivibrio sp.]|nr:acyl carrier protein [Pseudobutyrivibrio sp.]
MYFERVKEIMVETLNLNGDKIAMEAKLAEDLEVDSLDAMEVVLALEEEYSISIDPEALEKFVTVGDIVKYIEENK